MYVLCTQVWKINCESPCYVVVFIPPQYIINFCSCHRTSKFHVYVGLPKNSANLTIKKSFLTELLVSTISFEVVPLGMYTAIPACFP